MPPFPTAALPVVAPEVRSFAEEQGVWDHVPAVLEMTRRIFGDTQIVLYVEDDPEITDDRHLVFEVDAAAMREEEVGTADERWVRELFHYCPATHVCVFRLRLV